MRPLTEAVIATRQPWEQTAQDVGLINFVLTARKRSSSASAAVSTALGVPSGRYPILRARGCSRSTLCLSSAVGNPTCGRGKHEAGRVYISASSAYILNIIIYKGYGQSKVLAGRLIVRHLLCSRLISHHLLPPPAWVSPGSAI